nr:MAG: hypothetical protein DIU78_13720 [Pseudomonadota bacterium]
MEEVLGVLDESSHGPVFRRVCTERGFDFRAAGIPVAKEGDESPDGRILDRIAKLLALAESQNEHEAQAAMNAAQRLMLRYNIEELSSGRAHTYTFRHIGEPTGRVSEAERLLAAILHEYFFVDVIRVHVWRPLEGKRGTVLEVCGTPANVELAAYVHSFLTHTAERLFREHKRKNGIRSNATRRSFVAGVMGGFREKLAEERKKSQSEGLVWVGDPGLDRYFRARHPRIRWNRYRSQQGTQAYQEGKRAGRTIVLHRGVGQGPGTSVRLLGAASSRAGA